MNECVHHDNSAIDRINSKFLAPIAFLISLFICLIAYQSLFGIQPEPVDIHQTEGAAISTDRETLIQQSVKMHVRTHTRFTLNRAMECGKENTIYDFPTSYRELDEGEFFFDGRLMMPFKLDIGVTCTLRTMITYQPAFSIVAHSYYAPNLQIAITDKQN